MWISGGIEFVVISRTVSGFKMRTPSSSPPLSSIWQKRRKSGTVETIPPPPEKKVCARHGEAVGDHMEGGEQAALQKPVECLARHDFNDTAENIVTDGIFPDFA